MISPNGALFLLPEVTHYRTLFISDCHLGLKGVQSDKLLAFLQSHDAEKIYLVGDIIDHWCKGKKWHWTETEDLIIQNLISKANKGTQIYYIPGNHDEAFRDWCSTKIHGIEIINQAEHTTADGRNLWIIHGDEFDLFIKNHRWLCHLGHFSVQLLMKINRPIAWTRRLLKLPQWSLATAARRAMQRNSRTFKNYVNTVTREAARLGYDGVVCGHIHKAEFQVKNGVEYWNDGDWLESCTAIAEAMDGTMEILEYSPKISTISLLRERAKQSASNQPSFEAEFSLDLDESEPNIERAAEVIV